MAMLLRSFLLGFAILSLSPAFVWAHGEDKPGPHGGIIRMPGALHTEVVPLGDSAIAVYLLDIEFKNPTVANSSIEARSAREGSKQLLVCEPRGNRFECFLPAGETLASGKLYVRATREGLSGVEIEYLLPLRRNDAAIEGKHHEASN